MEIMGQEDINIVGLGGVRLVGWVGLGRRICPVRVVTFFWTPMIIWSLVTVTFRVKASFFALAFRLAL